MFLTLLSPRTQQPNQHGKPRTRARPGAINQLGYRPNRSARDHQRRTISQTCRLLVSNIQNPFFTIVKGVEQTLIPNQVAVYPATRTTTSNEQLNLEIMLRNK
ncbi:MAG: hypothetical protein U0X20_20890 [Caldilineaceae bacterium]